MESMTVENSPFSTMPSILSRYLKTLTYNNKAVTINLRWNFDQLKEKALGIAESADITGVRLQDINL